MTWPINGIIILMESCPMKQASRFGRPPKPPALRRTRRLQLMLTGIEHRQLSAYARKHNKSVAAVVREAVKSVIGQEGGSR